ncbi:MAG TPA: DNA internalization-related competence protein ComEC/Rec2 [Longimicrobiales bacterium]|nr:DNA internalization-related competence protein ComEC/Rec2 [Longimicrobiales bacterium]
MTLLLSVTLAFAGGLLGGLRQPLPMVLLAMACAGGALALSVPRRRAAVVLFIIAGAVAGSVRASGAARDCREGLRDGTAVHLLAVALVVPTDGVTLPVRARQLTSDDVTCANVVVRTRFGARHRAVLDSAVRRGAPLVVTGRWMAYAPRNGWPRKPEYAGGVLVDRIAIADIAPGAGDSVSHRGADALTRFRTSQQTRLRALLPDTWGLAEALLLAQKAGLSPETRSRWVAAGLVHLLAISGMHVGLIAGGVILLAGLCGVPRRNARRLALLVTLGYVLFLGAPSAALRALLQASLLLAAVELQRPADPFTALAAAGLVILLLEPLAILDPGFQLSFAGMAGLIGWRRPIAAALPGQLHPHVRDGLAAGVAASALTTPIAALHFGTASWIGIPASIVAVPVLACAVALLLAALLIAAVTGATAGLHASAADGALRLLDRIAAIAAGVPGGHGYMAASTVMYGLLAIAAALIVRGMVRGRDEVQPPSHAGDAVHEAFARRHLRRRLRAAIAVTAALALLAWAPLLLRPQDGRLEIHAIDVGQGDAFAIRTPAGRWLLVDTGPRTARGDAGRDRVVPYLLARGARRLDALILTHPDADHIGGAEAVLDAFEVGLVIDPGLPAGKDIFIDLLAAARRDGQRWVAARDGISFDIDGVRIALLFPFTAVDATSDANDNSVVFRLTFGAFAALFLGDAPVAVEEQLVARHGDGLASAVLKVGHHGSRTSTGAALLEAADPTVALVSAGRRNRYGHPNPGVLQRLEDYRVRVLRTDQSGNFIVRAARSGRIDVLAR